MHDIKHLVEWKARLFHCRQLAEKIGPDIELHGDWRAARHGRLRSSWGGTELGVQPVDH
jgi:hypothetical protein